MRRSRRCAGTNPYDRTVAATPIVIVVTAAREAQALVYEALLRERETCGDLPDGAQWLVVRDPGGIRIGSGAATVQALCAVRSLVARRTREEIGALLAGRRTFILHAGGDSRRVPIFAAYGKAFAPLPSLRRSGAPAALFDRILEDLLLLPESPEGDVIVASGDALVGASRFGGPRLRLDRAPFVGFAQSGSVERGARHGVYGVDRSGMLAAFLQKPSADVARATGVVRRDGTLLVDTGIVRASPEAAERLVEGFGVDPGSGRAKRDGLFGLALRGRSIDLYDEVLRALVPTTTERAYLGDAGGPLRAALAALRRSLRGAPCAVASIEGDGFLHFGTTAECVRLLLHEDRALREFGCAYEAQGALRTIGSSGVRGRVSPKRRAACIACTAIDGVFGGDNLVVGAVGPARIVLPRGWSLAFLPIGRSAWAGVLVHAMDDGKTPFADGGTIGGLAPAAWCARHGLDAAILGSATSWWDAPLWRVLPGQRIERWMLSGGRAAREWRSTSRMSFAELLARVNPERLVALERGARHRECAIDAARPLVRSSDAGIDLFASAATTRAERDALVAALRGVEGDPALQARALAIAARLDATRRPRSAALLRRQALVAVGAAAEEDDVRAPASTRFRLRADETVWTSAPARIDLAGGWSDTPPICQDLGGAVVNMAIDLDGRPPIHAIVKRIDAPRIELHSVDLGRSAVIRSTRELLRHHDPRDWTALPKAALVLAGIVPPVDRRGRSDSLARRLDALGGGLSVSILAAVPKGSGLGTSSILGATLLACLDRVLARTSAPAELVARTSLLEQRMATRGGWQDQIGGCFPGFKLATTEPGAVQRPRVEAVEPPAGFLDELRGRSVLIYSGLRRMARDILERVVERHLVRERGMRAIVDALKANAFAMRDAIRAGDLDAMVRELDRSRRLKAAIDPASTTSELEAMVASLGRDVAAWIMPGAGGGGFFFVIARSHSGAERIRAHVARRPPHPASRVVDWALAERGVRAGSV
jgi:fucokinase